MSYLLVTIAALLVAALTLFSGFGLGTLLMPVFALFFPPSLAVAATAIVHLANNLFKLALLGKWARYDVVLKFALPAAVTAVLGALLLTSISDMSPLYEYKLGSRHCEISTVKLIITLLILLFTVLEFASPFKKLSFGANYIPLGGALSGFFGGLSGHQGALRSAFLLGAGLEKKEFLGTVVVSAVVVDVSRLLVYGLTISTQNFALLRAEGRMGLVIAATLAAFAGSFLGSRLVEKVTMATVRKIVGVLLVVLAVALGAGVV
jgi:uncharacterized membrane protein YfcA